MENKYILETVFFVGIFVSFASLIVIGGLIFYSIEQDQESEITYSTYEQSLLSKGMIQDGSVGETNFFKDELNKSMVITKEGKGIFNITSSTPYYFITDREWGYNLPNIESVFSTDKIIILEDTLIAVNNYKDNGLLGYEGYFIYYPQQYEKVWTKYIDSYTNKTYWDWYLKPIRNITQVNDNLIDVYSSSDYDPTVTVNVSSINNYWFFSRNLSWNYIEDLGLDENALQPKDNPNINYSGCLDNWDKCGITDGSTGHRWDADTAIIADNTNQTFFAVFKPNAAESTYDMFVGVNDGWYLNDNGNDIQINTKDASGYDAFSIVSSYDTTGNTFYFIWSWTMQNSSGWFYCGALNYSTNKQCKAFDGTFAVDTDFSFGGRHSGGGEVIATYQFGFYDNKVLNETERQCVYEQVRDGNESFDCYVSSGGTPTNQSIRFENVSNQSITDTSFNIVGWINVTGNVSAIVDDTTYTNSTLTNYFQIPITGLSPSTAYSWNVTAYAGDNQSTTVFNGTFSVTTSGIGNTQATVNLVSPPNHNETTDTTPDWTWNFTDAENETLSCKIYIDGSWTEYLNATTQNNTNTVLNTDAISVGDHYWNISCDEAGNVSWSDTYNISITEEVAAEVTGTCVLNLTFDNASNPWQDYSGLNHPFNSLGNVNYINGSSCKWYGCANFSNNTRGVADHDYLNSTTLFSLEDGVFMSMWVYHDTAPSGADSQGYFYMGSGGDAKYIEQGDYGYNPTLKATNGTAGASIGSGYGSSATTWEHIALQYSPDDANYTFWLNGDRVKTDTDNFGDLNYSVGEILWLGLSASNIDLRGRLDEVLIYNRSNFTDAEVNNMWDEKRFGTPPSLDIFVDEIRYNMSKMINWTHNRNRLLVGDQMKITIKIENQGTTDAGNFNWSLNLSDSIICNGTTSVSSQNHTNVTCNWTSAYGYWKGWVNLDTDNALTQDGTYSSTNDVQRVYIKFIDYPREHFNLTEWEDTLLPYAMDSSNMIAYDSYNSIKSFDSEDFDPSWDASDVDPRGKKARENAMACFLNNWTEPESGSGKTQCADAIQHLYGWANASGWNTESVQSLHEAYHVMMAFDLMMPNLTKTEYEYLSEQFADICNDLTTHSSTQPYTDSYYEAHGGNGWGFGSGMAGFCYGFIGVAESNPTLMTEIDDVYWHYNSPDEWMDREEAYMRGFKNDSWAKYQEGWLYKFYSQYHLVENAWHLKRYDLGDFSDFNNAYCAMGREMVTDFLDYSYNGESHRNDEDRTVRGVQRGDSNSYEDWGSDNVINHGILTFYGLLCDDTDTKEAILYVRNITYNQDSETASMVETYIYKQLLDEATTPTTIEDIMPRVIFDNANDILTIRSNYTYINDTVIEIDGGEERGGGHSQAQGYYLYALGEPFLDYEQVPLEDDVRDERWKNGIALQNDTRVAEGYGGQYSATCGNAPLNQYYGMSDCTIGGTYPNIREFPITYGGDLEDYIGTEDAKFAGVYLWRPYVNASDIQEYFIKYGDVLYRKVDVSSVTQGTGIFDNKININNEFNETISGDNITYNRNGTNKFMTSYLIYTTDSDISVDTNPKNFTPSRAKTSQTGFTNITYQRIYRWVDNTSWSFIEANHWYYSTPTAISSIGTTDEGAKQGDYYIFFDTNGDNVINESGVNAVGWGVVKENGTKDIIAAFNTTSISVDGIDIFNSSQAISVHLDRNSDRIILTANTMMRDSYIDYPQTVSVRIKSDEMTNNSNFTVMKNGVTEISNTEGSNYTTFSITTEQNSDYYVITASGNESGGSEEGSNNAPIINSSRIYSSTNMSGSTILGYCNATDIDDDDLIYEYIWYLNQTYYSSNETHTWCYQESANVSTSCGGLDTGSYWWSGNCAGNDCSAGYDGSWGTYAESAYSTTPIYANYSIPSNASVYDSLVQVRIGTADTINLTPHITCLDYANTTGVLRFVYELHWTGPSLADYSNVTCINSSSGSKVYLFGVGRSTSDDRLYEEGVYWYIPTEYTEGIEYNIVNMSSDFVFEDHNWTFSCRGFDGSLYSDWLNSSTLLILPIPTNESITIYNPINISHTKTSFVIQADTNITANITALVNGTLYTNSTLTKNHTMHITGLLPTSTYVWNITVYAGDNQDTTAFNGTFTTSTLTNTKPYVYSHTQSQPYIRSWDTITTVCKVNDTDGDDLEWTRFQIFYGGSWQETYTHLSNPGSKTPPQTYQWIAYLSLYGISDGDIVRWKCAGYDVEYGEYNISQNYTIANYPSIGDEAWVESNMITGINNLTIPINASQPVNINVTIGGVSYYENTTYALNHTATLTGLSPHTRYQLQIVTKNNGGYGVTLNPEAVTKTYVNVTAVEIISGNQILNFNSTLNISYPSSKEGQQKVTADGNISFIVGEMDDNHYSMGGNITTLANGYLNTNMTYFSIDSNLSYTYETAFYSGILNITANMSGGSAITSFNVTLDSLNWTYTSNEGTTDGWVALEVVNGTYNITITASGYATNSTTYTVTSSYHNHTFFLLTGESVIIDVYDEKLNTPLTWRNVTIEFVHDTMAFNTSTGNATLFYGGLALGEWKLIYYANDYDRRYYYVNIENGSYNPLRLYLLNDTLSTLLTIEILDQNDVPLSGYLVQSLRYFLNSNSYDIVEMGETNTEGKTPLWVEQYNADYQFIIKSSITGGILKLVPGQKITSTTQRVNVNLGDDTLKSIWVTSGAATNITYSETTNKFYYTFSSLSGAISNACLKVTRLSGMAEEEVCYTCNSAASSTIMCDMTDYVNKSGLFYAEGKVDTIYTNSWVLTDTLTKSFTDDIDMFGVNGAFLAFMIIVLLGFTSMWNPYVGMVASLIGLGVTVYLGLFWTATGVTFFMGMVLIGIFILLTGKRA